MLLNLVLWSFTLVVVPLVVGFAWRQTNAAAQILTSAVHGPSAWPAEKDHAGKRSIRRGFQWDRAPMSDESLESLRRCDLLIARAEGDAPLQAFWRGVKGEYQADRSGGHDFRERHRSPLRQRENGWARLFRHDCDDPVYPPPC